ncbi:MAG: hydrolase [Armatimonadetes bacterium]|nr:hydrolase [Armatimonadota bacterium]
MSGDRAPGRTLPGHHSRGISPAIVPVEHLVGPELNSGPTRCSTIMFGGEAMHPNLLDREDTILIVVDIQEPFMRNLFEPERVIANSVQLIEAAKVLGVPVVTTLQYRARMGDIIPEVAQALPDDERIDKMTFSCCGVGDFLAALERRGRRTVLLCGIEAHICVNQTAHDLLGLGYKVHVAADAISSREEGNWRLGIEKMRQAGAVITTAEMSIFELLKDASASEFKQILQIVK